MSDFQTHTVENQPPEFAPRDLWADDVALREALAREGGEAHVERVARYGVLAGGELYALSFDAHRDRPRLRTHDRFRSEEHTSELQSLMRISYAVFCLKQKIIRFLNLFDFETLNTMKKTRNHI